MLKGVRQKQGYKSRKGHPAHITAKLEHGNGENFEKQIATDDYPTLLALPRYPVSPALKNSTGATKTTIDAWVFTSPNDVIDTFLNNTSATALNVGEIDYLKFARFLAKIGHCAAIAQYGINQLLPFTTGLILGDTRRAYLVGTNDNDTPATSTTRWQVRPRVHLATGIVVVDIRLFSDLGAPTYHVVAGMISHSQSNGCGAQRPPMFA